MPVITSCLWFPDPEPALKFYVSLFEDGAILSEQRMPDGSLLTATFRISGQTLMVLGGRPPDIAFTEAISLMVSVSGQAEVDRLWFALIADGGAESMCGWCRDRFGVSWQIVPTEMMEMLGASDREAAGRAMQAMLQMRRLDVDTLRAAFESA